LPGFEISEIEWLMGGFQMKARKGLMAAASDFGSFAIGKQGKRLRRAQAQSLELADRALLLAGRQACWQLETRKPIRSLADAEFRIYSQWGEDGILEWLIQNLPIRSKRFVEFGVENYREANTRFLLQNRNWKGLVMDGGADNIAALRAESLYWRYDLTAACEFITAENINDLLTKHGFDGGLAVLSIDIDGNDYWVLESITVAEASILVCEYNPILGDVWPIAVPYRPDFERFAAHSSGLYFGSSIKALQELASRKGYEFIGTNSNGINAFFVRRELFDVIQPLLKERRAYPSRHRDSRNDAGELSYVGGVERAKLIEHLPVIRLDDGSEVTLESLGSIYSPEWLADMAAQ
jgi:hypothetical protein